MSMHGKHRAVTMNFRLWFAQSNSLSREFACWLLKTSTMTFWLLCNLALIEHLSNRFCSTCAESPTTPSHNLSARCTRVLISNAEEMFWIGGGLIAVQIQIKVVRTQTSNPQVSLRRLTTSDSLLLQPCHLIGGGSQWLEVPWKF